MPATNLFARSEPRQPPKADGARHLQQEKLGPAKLQTMQPKASQVSPCKAEEVHQCLQTITPNNISNDGLVSYWRKSGERGSTWTGEGGSESVNPLLFSVALPSGFHPMTRVGGYIHGGHRLLRKGLKQKTARSMRPMRQAKSAEK